MCEERLSGKINEQYIFPYLGYDWSLIYLTSTLLFMRLHNSKCLDTQLGLTAATFPRTK